MYTQTEAPQAPVPGIHAGLDLYGGISSRPGRRRFADQLWAGNQIFTPSVGYLRWENGQKTSARVSVGVGDAVRGSNALYKQPVEAWAKQQVGAGSVTVGRFFTPFGLQEWQYEAREGVQWESSAFTLAVQSNTTTKRTNGYLRAPLVSTADTQLGVSLVTGKGFSYSSSFDQGAGIDATLTRGAFKLRSELDRFSGPQKARFEFAFGSVSYQRLPLEIQPYVSYYHWHDTSAAQAHGSYHTLIGGVTAPVGPNLSLDVATAQEGSRQNTWLQFHFTWEH
ncbi:hypothetical protein [Armatimonas sp.]|uniref:hypothetical protein n=1 Tax=Armatimonas sp. TaxID=1872638 RepID=UPI00374CC076